jgi:hypothetical protein
MGPAVTVAVEDANGNVESGDSSTTVSLAIGTNPSAGALSGGGPITVSSGVATFAGLSVNIAGAGYTLVASSAPGYAGTTSAPFTIAPGTSNQLAFVQGPTSAVAGSTMTPPVTVAVEDADGNVETGDNATIVSLALGVNPGGGTLTGGSATVMNGVATFSGLSVDKTGTGDTLIATSTPPYASATSAGFTITPGPPTQLGFVQGPSDTTAGSAMTPAVTVAVEDANGNVETGDNSSTIGLGFGANPGGGSLGGGGALQVSAGEATFSGLLINSAGTGYTLVASSTPSYPSAPSSSFNVGPGTPTHLAFLQGPSTTAAGATISPGVRVAVEDAEGNVESGDNATAISLALGTNPGNSSLTGGGPVTVVLGVATFNGLSLNKTGSGYSLVASTTSSDTAAASSSFTITPGPSSQLVFMQGPTDTAAGSAITPAVTVAVEDANGNVETGDSLSTVSLAIGTSPGGGTLAGGGAIAPGAGH